MRNRGRRRDRTETRALDDSAPLFMLDPERAGEGDRESGRYGLPRPEPSPSAPDMSYDAKPTKATG